uniref:Retrovirus-related Pol polyprotein from transposon TNT 1-94 n=1 Tax=Cajanus cajan TaxID=3821 RepID=A0A151S4J9_CAJCA|nr:Retrovirus-related Pol polyprotein from transposon TNT 1-94 [Cajanus cajan]
MKPKSETPNHIKSFIHLVETQFGVKVKTLRSDNGKEFMLNDFYNHKGIIHQTSCVQTPQQNNIVERKHQHILSMARALMFQSNMPKLFWNHAINHATFLINRLPTRYLDHKSPYQALFQCLPDINSLKVFGCLSFATTPNAHRGKPDPRAKKCVHLGYKPGTKGYLLFDIETKQFFVSRDVYFYEKIFPFTDIQPPDPSNPLPLPSITFFDNHDPWFQSTETPVSPTNQTTSPTVSKNSSSSNLPCRKSTRTRKTSDYLQDYHHSLLSSTAPKTKYPIDNYLSYDALSLKHKCLTLSISTNIEPHTYEKQLSMIVGNKQLVMS